MASHGLVHEEARALAARRPSGRGPFKLGWPQFWLLSVTLGGLLGLVALVFFVALVVA
jgi:hypothetical protein